MLPKLTPEQKDDIVRIRAENHSIEETQGIFYLDHPDAPRYEVQEFKFYFRQGNTKEKLKRVLGKVRKETRTRSYANKDDRLLALIEVSQKMMTELRTLKATDKSFVPLSRELRENFKTIREEVDPFNMEDEQIKSAYDLFMERAKGTQFENFFKPPALTQPTQGN